MTAESDRTANRGLGGTYGWPIGGILGGLVGGVAFGLFLWLFDASVLRETVPGLLGLEGAVTGWLIHLVQGAVLGLVFGFLVTRDVVLDTLFTDVETDALSSVGGILRMIGAGFGFALAVYTILPLVVIPMFSGALEAGEGSLFTAIAIEGLIGYTIFGVLLGAVFAATVDLRTRAHGGALEG